MSEPNDETQEPLNEESLQEVLSNYKKAYEEEFFVSKLIEDDPQLDKELATKVRKVLVSQAPALMQSAVELAVSPSVKDATRANMVKYLLELLMSAQDDKASDEETELSKIMRRLSEKAAERSE